MNTLFELHHLCKSYKSGKKEIKALEDINLSISKGEFVAIMGPSGSGKSTLLQCMASFDFPTSGQVLFKGKERKKEEPFGFIFQDIQLLDSLNGYENIALALTIQKENGNIMDQKIRDYAKKFEMESFLFQYPYQMSGGQKQKIAFLRALIVNPKMIFADEPTSALDVSSAKQVLQALDTFHKKEKGTIVMVTHDAFCASFASKVFFLKEGKLFKELQKEGSTKEFWKKIHETLSMLEVDHVS